MDFLLDNGFSANTTNKYGQSLLHTAVLHGSPEMVTEILKRGRCNPGSKPGRSGLGTRLGANVDQSDLRNDSRTALHHAVRKRNSVVVAILIEAGADVNKRDGNDLSPLGSAVEKGDEKMVTILLKAGAEVGICLHLAVRLKKSKVVRIFLQAKANVNDDNIHLRTPLHVAAKNDCFKITGLLLDAGADIFAKDKNQMTPLEYAVNDYEKKQRADIVSKTESSQKNSNYKTQSIRLLTMVHKHVKVLQEQKLHIFRSFMLKKGGFEPELIDKMLFDTEKGVKVTTEYIVIAMHAIRDAPIKKLLSIEMKDN